MGNQRIQRPPSVHPPSPRQDSAQPSRPSGAPASPAGQTLERASRLGHHIASLSAPASGGQGPAGEERVQRKFIVAGVEKDAQGVKDWISAYVSPEHSEIGVVVKKWAKTEGYTKNHENDTAAYSAADEEAKKSVAYENDQVAGNISASEVGSVAWSDYEVWASWYFGGLEYQDNKTNGWHQNKAGLLPGDPTAEGVPTRYVEFRRPGAVGKKETTKMERCIFDLLSGRCWPNAHYDGGYVEITGIPGSVRQQLLNTAFTATGMNVRAKAMTKEEKDKAGTGFEKIAWLLEAMKKEQKKE
jgi:hypothetical protein